MAVITSDTFNPLRRYVSVRLAQGVPLVDAEWNEKDDVRRFELRAYLKWFVGDGVPYGADAFRVQAAAVPAANDFVIRSGVPAAPGGTPDVETGLRHVGRCLVDGLDAIIEDDTSFRGQPLHVSAPGAVALAARLGTVTIPELPVLDGGVLVYLDVWEHLVGPDEEPSLVFPDIGTETCSRLRREWAVRARTEAVVPAPGDGDHEPGHSYYALARMARVAVDPVVYPTQVEDLRERRLLTPPATLIEDVLGSTPERYRRGLDRPVIPLRAAVNALLRGQLPSSPEQVVAPDPGNDFPTRNLLRVGSDTVVLWHSDRVAATSQVFVTRWPTDDPAQAGLNAPTQVTAGTAAILPSAVTLPTQPLPSLFVAYQIGDNIRFRRAATPTALSAAPETPVAAQAEPERHPVVVRTGQIVTVFWYWNGPGTSDFIRYRRRQYTPAWDEAGAVWLDGETTALSAVPARAPSSFPGILHAAADAAGRVWVAFQTLANDIAVARLTPATGAVDTFADLQMNSGTADEQPFVLVDGQAVWVFWRTDTSIHHARFDPVAGVWGVSAAVPGTTGGTNQNERPTALRDAGGAVWLLWSREAAPTVTDIWAVRRDPVTGGWGEPRQVTASGGSNDTAYGVPEGGAISLLFRSNRAGQFDLYFKQLITEV